jgi:hypothetical protein
MLGSYGPHPNGEAYTKNFDPEESPSGLIARTGTYVVRSRVVDDDGEVYAGKSDQRTAHQFADLIFRLGVVVQARQGMVNHCAIISLMCDFSSLVYHFLGIARCKNCPSIV